MVFTICLVMIRIGLLGCGNIGHIIGQNRENIEIIALYDRIFQKADEMASICGGSACKDFEQFISQDFDYVVEAASVKAVKLFGESVLKNGKHLIVLSVGAFSDPVFRDSLVETARAANRKIYIPSGAITGLDNLKVGRISPISKLLLRTTKNPESLGIHCDSRRLIFQGKANECIKEFPKNVNVSVALSLATGREADVELYADPDVDRNVHEIFCDGDFGEMYIRINNVQSPDNPATSYLAALSILTLLKNLDNPMVVGT